MFIKLNKLHRILIFTGAVFAAFVLIDLAVNSTVTKKKGILPSVDTKDTLLTKVTSELFFDMSPQPVELPSPEFVRKTLPPQKEIPKFSITDDPELLGGEGFFYIEDGVLYRNKLQNGIVVEYGQKIAEGIQLLAATQDDRTQLFTVNTSQDRGRFDNDLWLIDKELGTARKIYEDIYYAQISPDGEMIAISQSSSNEVHLIDRYGNLLNKVGFYGAQAVFSPDVKKVVYHKYADDLPEGERFGLSETSYGIAVYDITTGEESVLVPRRGYGDYNPIGFSSDGTQLYFMAESSSGGRNGLWVVDLQKESEPIELLGSDIFLPVSNNNAIWSSSRSFVVSQNGSEISLIHFSSDGKSAEMYNLGEGIAPRWKMQDKVIEFKGTDGLEEVDVFSLISE